MTMSQNAEKARKARLTATLRLIETHAIEVPEPKKIEPKVQRNTKLRYMVEPKTLQVVVVHS